MDLILPTGVEPYVAETAALPDGTGTVVNDTGLPDDLVMGAVQDHFVEAASMAWGHTGNTLQLYANGGSMLARQAYTTPGNVMGEIQLARELADKDDDIGSAIGWCLAAAFDGSWQNFHPDEETVNLTNSVCRNMKIMRACQEIYQEYLVAGSFTTVQLYTRENLEYTAFADEDLTEINIAAPRLGVLPAENVRVIGNDIFGTAPLAYVPDSEKLRLWLGEYFDKNTTVGRKAELGRQDRVAAAMFVEEIDMDPMDPEIYALGAVGMKMYRLNPRMVHRTSMPKGSKKYPTPPLARNFALLEAKRLLNIMDYALLQGGSNFIVVAKKGSDNLPAVPAEIDNLKNVVAKASRTGVIVGDHRLTFEILTPELKELLNPEKRRLLGRKLAMCLLRTPEHGTEDPQAEGMKAELQQMARVIMSDRHAIKTHIEDHVYSELRSRNKDLFKKGLATLFFPRVVLTDQDFWIDYMLKLRDRGDIPRSWGVEAIGMPFDAAIQARKREVDNDVDEIMVPAEVPFSSPEMGPQDSPEGRPAGSRNGRPTQDPGRPGGTRRVTRTPGETIRAYFDRDLDRMVRVGEITETLLEQYPDYTRGRIQAAERAALGETQVTTQGSLTMVPVNTGYETANEQVVTLRDGLRVVIGQKKGSKAFVTKLLIFREPEFTAEEAEERACRWGFDLPWLTSDDDS